MHRCYINSFVFHFLDPEDEPGTLPPCADKIPKRSRRRMSRLGILLSCVTDGLSLDADTTLVYGTTFTEANALETFLDSLPYASPTAFQTSIHPGGIEQALILKKQPVGAFFPIAGDQTLFAQMMKYPFTASTGKTAVCGGEEKGGWLRNFGVAHPVSFAFSLLFSESPDEAIGYCEWSPSAAPGEAWLPSIQEAVNRLHEDRILEFASGDHGSFKLKLE
jgi:hypothetical protein